MKTNRNEVGQFKRSRKGGLIVLLAIFGLIGSIMVVNYFKNASVTSYTAITATSTENVSTDTSDADIAKQTAVYEQGLVLAKQKKQLDAQYKADSDKLEKELEQNRKDQMSFQSPAQQ